MILRPTNAWSFHVFSDAHQSNPGGGTARKKNDLAGERARMANHGAELPKFCMV